MVWLSDVLYSPASILHNVLMAVMIDISPIDEAGRVLMPKEYRYCWSCGEYWDVDAKTTNICPACEAKTSTVQAMHIPREWYEGT